MRSKLFDVDTVNIKTKARTKAALGIVAPLGIAMWKMIISVGGQKGGKMNDLISRQVAIEIIQSMYPGMPRIPWLLKDWQKRYEPYIRTENAIRELPSAQPDIIRCEDCEHKTYCYSNVFMTNKTQSKSIYKHINFCSCGERRQA